MVPDMEMEAAGSTCVLSSSADDGVTNPELDPTQNGVSTANKRRRGRNPVDKEYRSLKRYNELIKMSTIIHSLQPVFVELKWLNNKKVVTTDC
ncbi:hypothetical protein CARUB_v10016493mg [Capsella rubella]|nr:hypothetical protein CARUB_v10016493mg [Capsella rubella]